MSGTPLGEACASWPDQAPSGAVQLCVHMGLDPNTVRTVPPAVEAAVYLEGGRGQRQRRKNAAQDLLR